MRKHVWCLLLVALLVVMGGCSKDSGTKNTSSNATGNKDSAEGTKSDSDDNSGKSLKDASKEDLDLYQQLFDLSSFVSVTLDISDGELAKIQADYEDYSRRHSKSPIYRKADKVTIQVGEKKYEIEDVGVRMKGNMSRSDFYDSSRGVYNLIHLKLSFNETFDDEAYYGADAEKWTDDNAKKERKNRTFATLEGIDLKWNTAFDTTHLCEYYCFQMFRDFDVMVPNLTPAALNVSGKNWGVFTLYEPIDKTYLERNMDEKDTDGDLYKAGWTRIPAGYYDRVTYGVSDPETGEEFNYDLKTNKKKSDQSAFSNLIATINDSGVTKESFETVVDPEYWVRFAAVDYFTGAPDNLRNNYNNHYVYFLADGRAIFFPYDYDIAFGATSKWNPTGDSLTSVSPYTDRAMGANAEQINPLFKLTIMNDGYYMDEYSKELAKVASSKWMKPETFEAMFELVKTHYDSYVVPDINFENADSSLFKLDINGGSAGNMPVKEYMEKILATYKNNK